MQRGDEPFESRQHKPQSSGVRDSELVALLQLCATTGRSRRRSRRTLLINHVRTYPWSANTGTRMTSSRPPRCPGGHSSDEVNLDENDEGGNHRSTTSSSKSKPTLRTSSSSTAAVNKALLSYASSAHPVIEHQNAALTQDATVRL
ncbi:hypothetical protein B0O80DRAFT_494976 [Mortierella sp. GBAus27b]|nr:hypothetical protein B0O80DRAFT_494976 [Mortierella sp. GBAus27b]